MARLMIYGAYGFTGVLTAELAKQRGVDCVLAGRNAEKVKALATRLDMPSVAFDLQDSAEHLGDVDAVLHCAGPFEVTFAPMLEACLQRGVHYMDITGEIDVFEAVAKRDDEAKAAGIVAMPGVGFDVVPSDCLAAHVAQQLPSATELTLAFSTRSRPSRGTMKTAVGKLGEPGKVRRDGKVVDAPVAHVRRKVDFAEHGPQSCASIPWGDVSTAFYTTGIANITTLIALPPAAVLGARAGNLLGPLLRSSFVRKVLVERIDAGAAGPDAGQRAKHGTSLWAEAKDPAGETAQARLVTPEVYEFTADASLRVAERVLAGDIRPGFWTPAKALGADFVLECDGVTRV